MPDREVTFYPQDMPDGERLFSFGKYRIGEIVTMESIPEIDEPARKCRVEWIIKQKDGKVIAGLKALDGHMVVAEWLNQDL